LLGYAYAISQLGNDNFMYDVSSMDQV
jgi:hypothetical protein